MMGDAVRPAPLPKPPQQRPQEPTRQQPQGSHEGEQLETWDSLESQENDSGDWVFTEPPSGEVLESEDL